MNNLFQSPDDEFHVEPNILGPEFSAALTSSLSKNLANEYGKPWTNELESKLQHNISALVDAAREHDIKTIRIIVTPKSGQKRSQELDIEKISNSRSLQ